MDLEKFYYSRSRKWIFCSIGIVVTISGLLNLLFFFYSLHNPQTKLFVIPAITSIDFILLGLTIIFLALDYKKTAVLFCLILFAFSIFQAAFFYFIEENPIYPKLTKSIIPQNTGDLSDKTFASGILFFLLTLAAFCYTLKRPSPYPYWIAGIAAGAALGFALYFLSFNLMGLEMIPLLEISLSSVTAFFIGLASLGLLFYGATCLIYLFPNTFIWWLPTLATIAAFFLTMTSWITFDAREKELIVSSSTDNLKVLKELMIEHGETFFNALSRVKNRWEILGDTFIKENYQKVESTYFTDFPWLEEYGLTNKEKKIISFHSPNDSTAASPLFSLIQEHSKKGTPHPRSTHVFFVHKDLPSPMLVSFSPFKNSSFTEHTFFYSESNVHTFFSHLLEHFLINEDAIIIQSPQGVLYESSTEDKRFKRYGAQASFEFLNTKLQIELWPLSNQNIAATSPASYYRLIIGLIFALTLFWALYSALMAYRKKAEADKANHDKTVFLANMSHEIRTPLHGIIGSCSLLERTEVNASQKKWITAINKSGKMLLELVDDLLDLSKIETSSITLEPIYLNLKNLLNDLIVLHTPSASSKNLKLLFDYPHDLSETFFIDGKRTRQIVDNLVNNSIKYTQEGFVKLSVDQEKRQKNGWLVFRVEDSGIGIAPDTLKSIFTKYLTIDIRSDQGTGLGLAIVKRLVDLMNGEIKVESQLGKGSIFTVKIPIVYSKGE